MPSMTEISLAASVFNETRHATSLSNTPALTAVCAIRLNRLSAELDRACLCDDWALVESIAVRIERLAYRVRLDSREHVINSEPTLDDLSARIARDWTQAETDTPQ